MQGQRSTVESFSEPLEFDHASGSSSSVVEQQVYWTGVLNPGEHQGLPDYLISTNDTDISYANAVGHDSGSFSGWSLGGPSSSDPILNQISCGETKMELGWSSSLTANAGTIPRLTERTFEAAANMLSLENVGINLNSNQIATGDLFLQNSDSNDAQNLEHNTGLSGNGVQVAQANICSLYNPFGSEPEQIQSASVSIGSLRTYTGGVGYIPEDVDGRPGALDGRRISGKRKNIEGVAGPSSGSGSSSCSQQMENDLLHNNSARHDSTGGINISSPSENPPGVNPPGQMTMGFGLGMRGAASECPSSLGVEGSEESPQRNFRMRINPTHQHESSPSNMWPSGNSRRRQNYWSSQQPYSLSIPSNQSLETRAAVPGASSQSQSHGPPLSTLPPNFYPYSWNGTSNSRTGSSSNSVVIASERLAALREEANSWSIPRNNIAENPVFVPAPNMRHLAQEPTSWSMANANMSIPGNIASTSQVGSSSSVHPSASPTWVPRQNLPSQYPQALQEFARRSFPSASSDPGGQSNNFLAQRSVHSSSSQDMVPQPAAGLRALQQPLVRPAFLMDRRNDTSSGPLSLRSLATTREGRSRIISEHIRNALDLMRRGEHVRFEPAFHAGADLHDRHREMRLDVDNMSYEELLALEERIGNVSTGLSEEAILKCLKQRKCPSMTMLSSKEVEPCCICQEEYVDGEDLGRLDCGHDFHTACIKQWLMFKNLCPICKTTALVA